MNTCRDMNPINLFMGKLKAQIHRKAMYFRIYLLSVNKKTKINIKSIKINKLLIGLAYTYLALIIGTSLIKEEVMLKIGCCSPL